MREIKKPVNLPRPLSDTRRKRADKKTNLQLMNCLSFIKSYEHTAAAAYLLDQSRKQVFSIRSEMMKNRLLPYYLVDLEPSKRQYEVLDTLFKAPLIIQKLIDGLMEKNVDTNAFLLTNKETFYNSLGQENWSRYVSFLRIFIDYYKQTDMVELELPMSEGCSLSASNKVFISSLSLGLINPVSERKVLMLRQWKQLEGLRYLPAFSIVFFDGKYYAKVKYSETDFHLRINKDLSKELEGTLDVLLGRAFVKELQE
uniref:hypothetical protein n=1 Tax=Pectobacterium polaris TaxID=2042057 RepID=UPI0013FD9452